MKQELKYIIPYLNYRLNWDISETEYALKEKQSKNRLTECKLVGINTNDEFTPLCCITNIKVHNNGILFLYLETGKPILSQLCDITDHIRRDCGYDSIDEMIENIRSQEISTILWNDLLNNHWDVFDLIPKGLAIDINTVKQE